MAVKLFKLDTVRRALTTLVDKVGGQTELQVGFFEDAKYQDGTPVAAVAAYNEFGTLTIPPRPFMRDTIAHNRENWGPLMGAALKASGYNARNALNMAGEKIASQMQREITDMKSPPNAPRTVKQKGFDKPLIDTGHMLNSVSYEVK